MSSRYTKRGRGQHRSGRSGRGVGGPPEAPTSQATTYPTIEEFEALANEDLKAAREIAKRLGVTGRSRATLIDNYRAALGP